VSEGNITRVSAQEALRRIERGESLTDWARVRAMSDEDAEAAAAADPDWQDVDPDWVAKAEPVSPVRKRRLTLALDEVVVDWFRSQDRHYRARMNTILRAYMERHRGCLSLGGYFGSELEPIWRRECRSACPSRMPVSLYIKNVPDEMVRRLKERAQRRHRSLQGELMAILEEAVRTSRPLTPDDALAEVRRLRLAIPRDAAAMIRGDRDAR